MWQGQGETEGTMPPAWRAGTAISPASARRIPGYPFPSQPMGPVHGLAFRPVGESWDAPNVSGPLVAPPPLTRVEGPHREARRHERSTAPFRLAGRGYDGRRSTSLPFLPM